jgi:hypothetical protein
MLKRMYADWQAFIFSIAVTYFNYPVRLISRYKTQMDNTFGKIIKALIKPESSYTIPRTEWSQ